MKINEVMKQFRECSGITLEEIAEEVGVTRQYISAIEKGKRNIKKEILKSYLNRGLVFFISCLYDVDDENFMMTAMETADGSNITEILDYLKTLNYKKVF